MDLSSGYFDISETLCDFSSFSFELDPVPAPPEGTTISGHTIELSPQTSAAIGSHTFSVHAFHPDYSVETWIEFTVEFTCTPLLTVVSPPSAITMTAGTSQTLNIVATQTPDCGYSWTTLEVLLTPSIPSFVTTPISGEFTLDPLLADAG